MCIALSTESSTIIVDEDIEVAVEFLSVKRPDFVVLGVLLGEVAVVAVSTVAVATVVVVAAGAVEAVEVASAVAAAAVAGCE